MKETDSLSDSHNYLWIDVLMYFVLPHSKGEIPNSVINGIQGLLQDITHVLGKIPDTYKKTSEVSDHSPVH